MREIVIMVRLIANATTHYLKRFVRLHHCVVIIEVTHDIGRIIVVI